MNIGNINFNNLSFLAPMAGICDRAFRELCVSYGASYVVGEMASAKGISLGDKKSGELLTLSEIERPGGIQLFGCEPDVMAEATRISLDYKPDIIDINMGCPAPKVAMNGCGSALMKSPKLAFEVTKAVVDNSSVPITVKIRKGWDNETINAVEIAKMCEKAGASAITVHGRTRTEMYSGKVDYNIIKDVKNAVDIPVIGNGDITDEQTATFMFEKTNCDAIMIGRGALGNPWIFQRLNAYFNECRVIPDPGVNQKMVVMLKHIKKIIEYKGEYTGMREARHHAGYYTKGLRGSAVYRKEIASFEHFEQLEEMAFKIVKDNE